LKETDKTKQGNVQGADKVQECPRKVGRKAGFRHAEKTKRKISRSRQGHGIYSAIKGFRKGKDIIDRRTAIGKQLHNACEAIISELGPSPSQAQLSECSLLRSKLGICHLIARELTSEGKLKDKQWLLRFFLQYSDSIGRSLERLPKLAGDKSRGPLDYHEYVAQLKSGKQGDAENG
jgi:hypothetical protein